MFDNPMLLFIQFMNGLSLGLNLFIIAAGLTLILGVLGVLNFAHGAFYMIGGYASYTLVNWLSGVPGGFWFAALGAAGLLALGAWGIERLMLRRLYGRDHVYQLLFTFALVLIIGDVVKVVWGSSILSVSFPPGLDGAVNLGIAWYPSYRLLLCAIGVAVAAGLWFFVNRTRAGRLVRAAKQDREMLQALGINVGRIYMLVFVAGSALAGFGGALAAPAIALAPGMDAEIIVECFIIVIIGGLGSLGGAFLGAIMLGLLTAFGISLFPDFEIVMVYLMMVLVLLIRPWGLLGKPQAGG
ncbi:branched-chain amino acid ABC transporter permease [Hoeflea prorocentri]|uniref:Branched-chain amino acid ABC transporter permease n=1 Tax=Hoeflea prorocentri TaxID=1922333 RepID=A0A9X3UM13_9HYPH|nr:branched-chain amino acid ABC transporter permease [Hoeflea prorocentri]MCY6383718.1 branched-chain amino acid ABC transporter permease [Hoeflea prorocentri]MDA5401518.1 branched-chain amino acid ABC transporter permease [Hoeflea prorocentri]